MLFLQAALFLTGATAGSFLYHFFGLRDWRNFVETAFDRVVVVMLFVTFITLFP
jgi:hypothetical protein